MWNKKCKSIEMLKYNALLVIAIPWAELIKTYNRNKYTLATSTTFQ